MTDERCNLPSASIIPRLALCPGSWHKARGLPELSNPEMAEWGASGDRIHLWLEDPTFIDTLTPDEIRIGRRCHEARDKLAYQVFPDWDKDKGSILAEKRFWLNRQTGEKHFSGRLDFAAVSKDLKTALLIDYKANRGDIPASESNLQLRAQAVLLWTNLACQPDRIYASIVQPLVSKPLLCQYEREHLAGALLQLEAILDAAEQPNAKLVPGKAQCQHCPARLSCDVAWKEGVETLLTINPAFLDGPALALMLDKWQLAKVIGKDLDHRAKSLIKADPDSIPNWTLKEGGSNRTLPDPYAVFKALKAGGLVKSPKEFIQRFCSLGIGALEEVYEKEIVAQHCGTLIVPEPKEPSLKRL